MDGVRSAGSAKTLKSPKKIRWTWGYLVEKSLLWESNLDARLHFCLIACNLEIMKRVYWSGKCGMYRVAGGRVTGGLGLLAKCNSNAVMFLIIILLQALEIFFEPSRTGSNSLIIWRILDKRILLPSLQNIFL